MNPISEKLQKCHEQVRQKTDFVPRVALILGSGLGGFADMLDAETIVNYSDIEGFPVSTVAGHAGRFIFGTLEGVPVAVMQGRVHYYEGYSMSDVVLPVRLMGLLGAKTLLLTNAAGGINRSFSAGDLMLITGQISSFVPSPLIGLNPGKLGVRFPDMSEIYGNELRESVKSAAQRLGVPLREGVYVQTSGPNYESPEEIRMLGLLGADAVGMSTACEAIAANHMGMRVCGISCISNLAAGISPNPLTHQEVQDTADKTAPVFRALIKEVIKSI
ncbi:MAG: purine-nucleoside phosphorylase [Oscillospiraceae bacterium]|nr:purine-nucleoside phosphorylase [Oscillospiraceae bacterium]